MKKDMFEQFKKDFIKNRFFIGYDEYKKYEFKSTEYETKNGIFYVINNEIDYEILEKLKNTSSPLTLGSLYKNEIKKYGIDYIARKQSFINSIENNKNKCMLYLYNKDYNEIVFVKYSGAKRIASEVIFIKMKKVDIYEIPLIYNNFNKVYIFNMAEILSFFGSNKYFKEIYNDYVENI